MARLLNLTPSLPWRRSDADRHYGVDREKAELALADFSCRLWREAGVEVPAPAASGDAWLIAGRSLAAIGTICVAALLLSTALLAILLAVDASDEAIAALVMVCATAVGAFLLLPGAAMVGHGKRLLLWLPLDLSPRLASGRNPTGGRHCVSAGTTLLAAGPLAVLGVGVALGLGGPLAITAIAAMAAVAGGVALIRRGQAMLQPSAEELRTVDQRRPVLLLRSFDDEEESVVAAAGQGHNVAVTRLEEAIARQFAPFGPLVAIGRPGEELPTLGAARSYKTDAEWRAAVAQLMGDALMVVVIAGTSRGLGWELDALARGGHLHKLLVLMPGSERQQRWAATREALVRAPGFAGLPEVVPPGLLALHATDQGGGTLLTVGRGWAEDYALAIDYGIYGLFSEGPATAAA